MKRFSIGLVSFALWALHSIAVADLEQGYQAYQRGDMQAAVAAWRPLAEQGDTVAQFNLGQMYRMGKGVPTDDREALRWYTLAARQGSTYAEHNVKLLYRDGRISQEDYESVFPATAASDGSQDEAVQPTHVATTATDGNPPATDLTQPTIAVAAVTASPATAPSSLAATPNEGNEWLQGLDPGAFVVQLMATPKGNALSDYLKKNPIDLAGETNIVRTKSKGQDWYVLLLGPFADHQSASTAVGNLPSAIQRNKPWIRPVSAVQSTAE